jgi:hypothetical protein
VLQAQDITPLWRVDLPDDPDALVTVLPDPLLGFSGGRESCKAGAMCRVMVGAQPQIDAGIAA